MCRKQKNNIEDSTESRKTIKDSDVSESFNNSQRIVIEMYSRKVYSFVCHQRITSIRTSAMYVIHGFYE